MKQKGGVWMSEDHKRTAENSEEIDVDPTDQPEEIETEEVQEETDEVKVLEAKNSQLEDQILRLQAEMQNIQRRNTRERQEAAKYRSQKLATALLEAIDNLERALATEADSEDAKSLLAGVEMVHGQILQIFADESIEVIDPAGEAFDPNYHQAVSTTPAQDDQESDEVAQVLQKGYQLEDRVIRPAMVVVTE